MKRLLSIAALIVASVAASLPLSASAQTRVHVVVGDHGPVRVHERHVEYGREYDRGYDRHERARYYRTGHAYAPSAWDARHGRYVEPRRWVDRNHDGMDDRRGRRDLDRDGVPDRYDRDLDNDGIANVHDRDIDGDGVRNRRDRRPDNPHAY